MADHKLNYFPEQLGQSGQYIPIAANAIDVTSGDNSKGTNWSPLYLDQNGHFVACTSLNTLKTTLNNVINRISFSENNGNLTITINTVSPIS